MNFWCLGPTQVWQFKKRSWNGSNITYMLCSLFYVTWTIQKILWTRSGSCAAMNLSPFHSSTVCSLSSSCLSGIFGGGWGRGGKKRLSCTLMEWKLCQLSISSGAIKISWAAFRESHSACRRSTYRFHFSRVIPNIDVGVLQGFVHRDALGGVDYQHLG